MPDRAKDLIAKGRIYRDARPQNFMEIFSDTPPARPPHDPRALTEVARLDAP
jgi:hypothetical protein